MGREVSVAPGEYKFAAYLVEPSRGSCRDAGSKSRRPRTNVTLGRWATLRRCSAFWLQSPRLSLATSSTCARSRRGSRYHLFFSLWPRR